MRASILGLALALLATACTTPSPHDTASHQTPTTATVRAMTFNIRYDNPADGENAWPHRRDAVASLIRFHEADIAGLQEVLHGQLLDLDERLPDHERFGVARDDGVRAGEYSPVFYRSDRFHLVRSGTRWLSPTPEAPGSMGWDAACPRIVTWGELRDRASGLSFFVFNTHFDHRGEIARLESARALAAWIREIAKDAAVLVTGDFNCPPSSPPIRTLTDENRFLVTARSRSRLPAHGPSTTWNGFADDFDAARAPIDHVFVRPATLVLKHGVLTERIGKRHVSDHFAVVAELHFDSRLTASEPTTSP